MKLVATAYCIHGTTASGAPTSDVSVATDPRIIPTGSELLVDGQFRIAQDTGGNIKGIGSMSPGAHAGLDKWYSDCADAVRWGRHWVDVKIIGFNRYPLRWTAYSSITKKPLPVTSKARTNRSTFASSTSRIHNSHASGLSHQLLSGLDCVMLGCMFFLGVIICRAFMLGSRKELCADSSPNGTCKSYIVTIPRHMLSLEHRPELN